MPSSMPVADAADSVASLAPAVIGGAFSEALFDSAAMTSPSSRGRSPAAACTTVVSVARAAPRPPRRRACGGLRLRARSSSWGGCRPRRRRSGSGCQGRLQGVPGQGGALDSHRELSHPGECRQLAQLGNLAATGGGRAGDQSVEALEETPCLGQRLAAQRLGHHRGGGGRDGAAHALEGDLLDAPVLDPQGDLHPVAAERVVTDGAVAGPGQAAEIARPPVVVEDDLSVQVLKLAEAAAHANTSRTRSTAAARASTSSRVL